MSDQNWLGYGDYLRFRELVHELSGLHFPEKKLADLGLALRKALADAPPPITTLDDYYYFLKDDSQLGSKNEIKRLINLLTIGETHFFRDSAQMEALASQVLPALINRKREEAAKFEMIPHLRVWSAGCASGEEAYSLAILLRELMPDLAKWQLFILATDINNDLLDKARAGIYSDWSFREPRAIALRPLYFHRDGEQEYRLRDEVKQMVTFARHNLIEDKFPSLQQQTTSMDLIVCRNVTIYFKNETTQRLIKQFYETLQGGGWLVVGHSDPVMGMDSLFEMTRFPGSLLYQKRQLRMKWTTSAPYRPPKEDPPPTLYRQRDDLEPKPKMDGQRPFLAPPRRTGMLSPLAEEVESDGSEIYQTARRLLSQGKINVAIKTLESNLDALPETHRAYSYCLLARAYADQGQWDKARHWCQATLKIDTLLPEVYFVLAMIHENEGNLDAAIANLKKVNYLDSQRPLAHFNLAMLYRQTGQKERAQRALKNCQRALDNCQDDEILPDSGGTTAQRLRQVVIQVGNL